MTTPQKPARASPAEGPQATDGIRHAPVQERGRRRVQSLLAAAAAVIAEVGVDATTTNAVAARAGTSVGVLYRFFPNKQALVEALAQGYVSDIDDLLGRQEQEGIAQWPLPEAIVWIVQATMTFHQAHPAFQHVYRAMHGFSTPASEALLDRIKRLIDHLLALRTPTAAASVRQLHATVAVEAANSLLIYATTRGAPEREQITRETIDLLVRYLSPFYAPTQATPSSVPRRKKQAIAPPRHEPKSTD